MRDGGRLAAAIAVLEQIDQRHLTARLALKAWGDGARYAGAKDRAFVSGLVLDGLRHRRSLAWRMNDGSSRALALAVLAFAWRWPLDRISIAAGDAEHGAGALGEAERTRLLDPISLADAPAPVRGDYPDWLAAHMERAFGGDAAVEGSALAERAPIDLRVNRLKSDVGRTTAALAAFHPAVSEMLPDALRIAPPAAAERAAPVEGTPAFEKGWFEVQDLGSQIAAAAAGEIAHRQVLDFCAGGGGKTLALAAAMANTGQLWAYDADPRRLAETQRRASRAGVRNLQIRSPLTATALAGLEGRMDLVFVDAPCSGSGAWRRRPDAKWRLTEAQFARRMAEQDAVLAAAAPFVKPGGRMIYATCSIFTEENEDRLVAFLPGHPAFRPIPAAGVSDAYLGPDGFIHLTPARSVTDGFFVAVLERGH